MIPTTDWHDSPLAPRIRGCMAAWDLGQPQLIATTRMGAVLRVRCGDGRAAVLKCLSATGLQNEARAAAVLDAFDGQGAARLLAANDVALLIEYCPGPQLDRAPGGISDAVAIPVICAIVKRLHRSAVTPPPDLPDLAQRCAALGRGLRCARDSQARLLLGRAMEISADLLASAPPPRLLHGDLHHENILMARRDGADLWVAIDPQGIMGDPAYEVANIFGNPRDHPDIVLAPGRCARLADHFAAALRYDRSRLLAWAFVHSCISAAWSLEDGDDPAFRLRVADSIAPHLQGASFQSAARFT